ncbi:hypothetical protein TCAL_03047 [Tigriopus californicus]|uniref:Xylulose kinase n=1 Tax=Tigriopus californicus TaxID=6832 RepID=A0A553NTU0_TIGCA|nr:xylulose kinase-like [Tigriopus californicus]TRY68841.1 hypothetical protein TCAL_03047 [Tigriopus californicus]|eukprot:TCALIF_03047-PA protein Name:"Similar to XYLB Xylulose kinase (Homo sapiens)" AED:0.06 eAED:0.06 QI:689/1/1/1/1/1/9/136/677
MSTDFDDPSSFKAVSEGDPCLYLGLDFSTQQVKALVMDDKCRVIAEEYVQYDAELPEYRTHGGVLVSGNRVTSPAIMWVKALDMVMEKIRISGIDFGQIAALSGCGQQHGSVYWRQGIHDIFQGLNPDKFLHDELAHAFSILDSPVWMDSSTTEECRILEELLGGPQALAEITGSRAFERFTGSQISKMFKERHEAYTHTERISLVSSFACSLFLGDTAPIEVSDAGGMNLLDLKSKDWCQDCLDACGSGLREKLGQPIWGFSPVGTISNYMVERYGFESTCQVLPFTGDNQSALAGLRMGPGDIGISLGTSDTLFIWLGPEDAQPQLSGHVWPNPVDQQAFMALLCYKNGSLTRERLCQSTAEGSWDLFNQLLDSTPRGNFGNIGMYYDFPEITPSGVQGDFRFSKNDERVSRFASKEAEVRALLEGQFMAKRIHAERMGFTIDTDTRILVCGGASVNSAILQIISDVFQAPVLTLEEPRVGANSAALGGALRARYFVKTLQGGKRATTSLTTVPHSAPLDDQPQEDPGPKKVLQDSSSQDKDGKASPATIQDQQRVGGGTHEAEQEEQDRAENQRKFRCEGDEIGEGNNEDQVRTKGNDGETRTSATSNWSEMTQGDKGGELCGSGLSFTEVSSPAVKYILACSPHKDAASIYKPLLERFRNLEQRIIGMGSKVA